MQNIIKKPNITSEEIDRQIGPVLRKMELFGVMIDCDRLGKLDTKLSQQLVVLEKKIVKLAEEDFNVSSPTQLAEILFSKLKLPTEGLKKTKSGISTAAHELLKIADQHSIIPLILEYRELSKLVSTYLKPLPVLVDKNSRLHTTYSLETSTGRLTSSEPNLQNIPIKGRYGTEVRSTFVAAPGMKLIAADYSQIELRIVACLANDKIMLEAFKNKKDIHAQTAGEIFGVKDLTKITSAQRRVAKAVNFGLIYGQTPYGLSQALGISTNDATKYIREYFEAHPGILNYINEMIKKAHTDGYVETLFGQRRYLPNINSTMRFVAEGEERMAINMPVQGTAAEILKLAMVELDQKLPKFKSKSSSLAPRMLLTVHDEIIVETPTQDADKIAETVKETMENVVKFCIPIEVSVGIGDNWAEAK